MTDAAARFTPWAWRALGYNILVILWGAWVRITGSGAGCGDHWPTCGGTIIPRDPQIETIIELTHRLTSGLTLIFALMIFVWARKVFAPGHRVRIAAGLTLAFILAEAALGALLVLKGLVDKDASASRAVVVALHLVNTYGLVGFGALTAWWSTPQREQPMVPDGASRRMVAALLGMVAVGMTGAVTALGDTLFPITPATGGGLFAHVVGDLSTTEHFLVRLRVVHPIVAVVVGLFVLGVGGNLYRESNDALLRRLGGLMMLVTMLQIGLGMFNVLLAAPGWMQLIHLLVADVLWVVVVLTTVQIWGLEPRPTLVVEAC
jgi:heme A synthase